MLDPRELEHLNRCIDETKKIPLNSPKWESRLLWLRERTRNSWLIGSITVFQYQQLEKRINRIENARKLKLKNIEQHEGSKV